mmetsp:Transcript_10651/g.20082  ORF Transcript_10651/g.20082 Transcript_10651/m.20082 type:complete len:536 (+) Transcript_10651:48-1655(+)
MPLHGSHGHALVSSCLSKLLLVLHLLELILQLLLRGPRLPLLLLHRLLPRLLLLGSLTLVPHQRSPTINSSSNLAFLFIVFVFFFVNRRRPLHIVQRYPFLRQLNCSLRHNLPRVVVKVGSKAQHRLAVPVLVALHWNPLRVVQVCDLVIALFQNLNRELSGLRLQLHVHVRSQNLALVVQVVPHNFPHHLLTIFTHNNFFSFSFLLLCTWCPSQRNTTALLLLVNDVFLPLLLANKLVQNVIEVDEVEPSLSLLQISILQIANLEVVVLVDQLVETLLHHLPAFRELKLSLVGVLPVLCQLLLAYFWTLFIRISLVPRSPSPTRSVVVVVIIQVVGPFSGENQKVFLQIASLRVLLFPYLLHQSLYLRDRVRNIPLADLPVLLLWDWEVSQVVLFLLIDRDFLAHRVRPRIHELHVCRKVLLLILLRRNETACLAKIDERRSLWPPVSEVLQVVVPVVRETKLEYLPPPRLFQRRQLRLEAHLLHKPRRRRESIQRLLWIRRPFASSIPTLVPLPRDARPFADFVYRNQHAPDT